MQIINFFAGPPTPQGLSSSSITANCWGGENGTFQANRTQGGQPSSHPLPATDSFMLQKLSCWCTSYRARSQLPQYAAPLGMGPNCPKAGPHP